MRVNSEILAALSEATPGLRRYARALGAGAAAAVADGLTQSALQSVGARLFARELRPAPSVPAGRNSRATGRAPTLCSALCVRPSATAAAAPAPNARA